MGYVANILYMILQICALVLICVGCPLDQMKRKGDKGVTGAYEKFCITLWGLQAKCYKTEYIAKSADAFPLCSGRASRFKAAEACCIIAICAAAAGLLLVIFSCCCSACCPCCKYLFMLASLVAFATSLITWAIMLDAYMQNIGAKIGTCDKLKNLKTISPSDITLGDISFSAITLGDGMKLGTGWILILVGCIVSLVNAFVALIPC